MASDQGALRPSYRSHIARLGAPECPVHHSECVSRCGLRPGGISNASGRPAAPRTQCPSYAAPPWQESQSLRVPGGGNGCGNSAGRVVRVDLLSLVLAETQRCLAASRDTYISATEHEKVRRRARAAMARACPHCFAQISYSALVTFPSPSVSHLAKFCFNQGLFASDANTYP